MKYKVTFEARTWEDRVIEADDYTDAWEKANKLAITDDYLNENNYETEHVTALRRDPLPYVAKDTDGGSTRYAIRGYDRDFVPRGGYNQNPEDYA